MCCAQDEHGVFRSRLIDARETPLTDRTRPAPLRRRWVPHTIWALLVLGPFGAYLAWLSQTTLPDGQCSGIGWGCSLAGWDAVGFTLIILGVPIAVVWLVGHLVIAIVQRRGHRRGRSGQEPEAEASDVT